MIPRVFFPFTSPKWRVNIRRDNFSHLTLGLTELIVRNMQTNNFPNKRNFDRFNRDGNSNFKLNTEGIGNFVKFIERVTDKLQKIQLIICNI